MVKQYNIFDVVKDAITGRLKFADKDTVTIRRSVCDTCEARNTTLDICTVCGCVLKAKIRLKESTCPMDMW